MHADKMFWTVGPVLYDWPRKTLIEFHAGIADSPVDTVVLASQALIDSEAELRSLRRIADQGDFPVGAGDA